jgi:hypothetical protein
MVILEVEYVLQDMLEGLLAIGSSEDHDFSFFLRRKPLYQKKA